MCTSNNESMINDDNYSLLTAKTGIATVSAANTSLTGAVPRATVISASGRGITIKSIIIKAIQPTTAGMVRLFIANSAGSVISLFKEIPIPVMPMATNTPVPVPIYQMFETKLEGPFMLNNDYHLYATTQNQESFNIIAEAIEWKYTAITPTICCNFKQTDANTGLGTISVANTALNGFGTIVPIFTAADNGSVIKAITIKALQNTNVGMIRLFISPDGITWSLMQEIPVPQTNQSGFDPSFKQVLEEDYTLEAGCMIGAATQIAQSFALTVEGRDWSYA